MRSDDVFTRSVDEAEARFLQACAAADAEVASFRHPLRGPHGETLHTIVARLGPADASDHLVLVSGTHGIEGHAGAAIQCSILEDRSRRTLAPGTALTLVHLINPWGCAWDRRVNEDNVDLFRNFLYRDPPYRETPDYDAIAPGLMLPAFAGPEREEADRRFAADLARLGRDAMQRIVTAGTHHHPEGINFNGAGPTWSRGILDRIVDGWFRGARRIALIDVHTGFGPPGDGLIMSYDPPDAPVRRRIESWLGAVHQLGGGQSRLAVHSAMPYDTIARRLDGAETTVIALEFGTDGIGALNFDLVREENLVHRRGDPCSPEGRLVRARYRARYYVERPAWKAAVLRRGLDVFDRTKAGLAAWSRAACA